MILAAGLAAVVAVALVAAAALFLRGAAHVREAEAAALLRGRPCRGDRGGAAAGDPSMSITTIRRWGKARRLKAKKDLAHKPSGHGKGRWHSRTSLWASKRKDRRKRLIANESRRRNRAA